MPKRKAETDLNHTNWDKEDEEYPTNKRPNSTLVLQSSPKSSSSDYQNQQSKSNFNTPVSNHTTSSNSEMSNSNELSDSTDLKTKRSKHFLSEIAALNRDLVDWLNSTLKEKPEALLTRVFLDHQRHVQKLFDEERKLDLTAEQIRILDNQEKVLHMLTERKPDDGHRSGHAMNNSLPTSNGPLFTTPVTSNGTHHKSNVTTSSSFMSTPMNNANFQHSRTTTTDGTTSNFTDSATKSSPFANLSSVKFGTVSEPTQNFAPPPKKSEEKLPFASFFSNTTSSSGTSALNNGIMNSNEKMVNPFFVSQPTTVAQTNETAGNVTTTFSSNVATTFSSNVAATFSSGDAKKAEEEDEDTPPKVEVNTVVEEGAVYTKRCKVFMKKESGEGYDDHGIGNLFLKPVSDSGKTQLIIRSDTNLGNLLVNVILSADLPVKKMNATNAMVVCVPMPGAALRTLLVRVKAATDCDELVEKLNQYKAANR